MNNLADNAERRSLEWVDMMCNDQAFKSSIKINF